MKSVESLIERTQHRNASLLNTAYAGMAHIEQEKMLRLPRKPSRRRTYCKMPPLCLVWQESKNWGQKVPSEPQQRCWVSGYSQILAGCRERPVLGNCWEVDQPGIVSISAKICHNKFLMQMMCI